MLNVSTASKHLPPDAIQGRVATLISLTEIVVNRGHRDGVSIGMTFEVRSTVSITDPDTKEHLGKLPVVVARITATDVRSNHFIGQTDRLQSGGFLLPIRRHTSRSCHCGLEAGAHAIHVGAEVVEQIIGRSLIAPEAPVERSRSGRWDWFPFRGSK